MSITIKCRKCGTSRKEYPYQIKKGNGLYCSRKCANKANAKNLSKNRLGKSNPMFGKRPWNYIDGRGGKRHPTTKYWIWKREVHNRDKNTCQKCLNIFPRKYLIAHHKKPWAKYHRLRHIISNGLTLCRPCHNKIDRQIKSTQF